MVKMLDVLKNVFHELFSARWRRSWTCLRLACDRRNNKRKKKEIGKRDTNTELCGSLSKQEGWKDVEFPPSDAQLGWSVAAGLASPFLGTDHEARCQSCTRQLWLKVKKHKTQMK